MLCSVVRMLPRVITYCCAVMLHVTKSYYMLHSVFTCYHDSYYMLCNITCLLTKLLHDVQFVMLPSVGECYYTWLTKGYYMLYVVMCSVVTCYQELLHAVQCC